MALFANPALRPGMNLMQNLNMPRKIGVLSATFFIPVVLMVYELWSYSHASIDFTRVEVDGVAYIKPLNVLMDSAVKLQNSESRTDAIKAGDNAISELNNLAATRRISSLDHSIATLTDNWKRSQNNSQGIQALVESITTTYADVADRSNLTHDPDLDTFYLMYAVTDVTPRLAAELENYELQLSHSNADKQVSLLQSLARINLQRTAITKAMSRAAEANKDLASKIPLTTINADGAQLESSGVVGDSSATKQSALDMWKAVSEFSTAATNELDKLLKQRLDGAQSKIAIIAIVAFVLFSPALYLLLCFYVSNNSGFGAMISRMKKLAKGDLSLNFPAQGIDEISILINSLNDSRGQLQNLIANIRKSADNIDRAGQQIGSVANKLRQQQASQSETVKHTAQNVSEVSRKVQLNLNNAVDANRCAEDAFGVATKGNEVVAQVVTTMQTISTSSNKIGDIIGVIDDIAFQTNLLALNAAVEAARAGEQGAGFAVVAAEVRNLAQRSSTAASEIKKLITYSLENVNRGATLVNTAGNTMHEILQSVQRVSELMSDITTASKTQAEDIGRLNQAVSKIDEDSLRSVALVKDTSAAMSTLDTEVGNLLESVSYFTFEGEAMSDGMYATTQISAPAIATPAAISQKRVA